MEQHGVSLSGSMALDAYCSSVTNGCRQLPAKRYVEGSLSTYMNQTSALHCVSDFGDSTDIRAVAKSSVSTCDRTYSVGGPVSMRDEHQFGPSCCMSSTIVEESRSSASTDSVHITADSSGVTLATEALTDDVGKLPEISESHLTNSQSDICADDFDGEMQPLGDSSVCSVCGDIAAGFHCGAYVCEACKVIIFNIPCCA